MPECEECGREFDTERGLHIHQAEMHDESYVEKLRAAPLWKLATVVLAFLLLVTLATDMDRGGEELEREDAVSLAMEHLQEDVKGGSNATLVSSSDTGSQVYRMDVDAYGNRLDLYVTKDGKYLFFNHARIRDSGGNGESGLDLK